ncbi:Alpha/Beta hydrolase protein [Sporodiniella umbellata]|nr:Alpha/Beta hydrolase protein [Sporodiniella umbellata]
MEALKEEGYVDIEQPAKSRVRRSKYSPYRWQDYFEESKDIAIDGTEDVFRIYQTAPAKENGPIFVMHHGAGSSALSFGWSAKYVCEITQRECGVLAIDCRGHGATKAKDSDYTLERLANDLISVIKLTLRVDQDIILVGHSMGGPVMVRIAKKKVLKSVLGVAVLDVVEGSAVEGLASMTAFLNSRPKHFGSYEQAIHWSLQSNTIRNPESSRLSIPPLLQPGKKEDTLEWITDLHFTQPYWSEWFTGLSEDFLTSGTAKLLILAGTDRLDKTLIIGQMQGKFQLEIFPEAGHFLQEDTPMKTARCLVDFWKRNRRLVLPPKVSNQIN